MVADSTGLGRHLTLHLLLLAQVRLASDSSDDWLLVSPTVGWGRLQAVPPHIISMVERCVGTGEDGLGEQLALLCHVNLGQRILHLHLLVVIGRLGLVLTRGLRSLEIAVVWGLAHCGTDPSSNVGGSLLC